jgi:hypothetical protein
MSEAFVDDIIFDATAGTPAPSQIAGVLKDVAAGRTTGTGRLGRLVDIVERLTHLLDGENEMLSQRLPRSLLETQDEKVRLTDLYAKEMRDLQANPALISALPESEKAELKAAMTTFRSIMETHARKLVAFKSITEGMVQAVSEEVEKQNQPIQGYGRQGMIARPVHAYGGPRPTSIAVNQSI